MPEFELGLQEVGLEPVDSFGVELAGKEGFGGRPSDTGDKLIPASEDQVTGGMYPKSLRRQRGDRIPNRRFERVQLRSPKGCQEPTRSS